MKISTKQYKVISRLWHRGAVPFTGQDMLRIYHTNRITKDQLAAVRKALREGR